jgi:iron(III) transport system substrate-binding protein
MIKVNTCAARRLLAAALVMTLGGAVAVTGCGRSKGGRSAVVVYTAEKDEIIQAVRPLWSKAAPGANMSALVSGTNEVVQRIRSEQRRPLGDVLWGVGAEGIVANPDLFEPYTPAQAKAIDPRWLAVAKGEPWIPNNVVPMVLMYNTKLVSASEAPHGWRDLADPRWKGKLAYAAPDKSGSAYTQLATMVAVFGDNDAGWKTIERIMRNARILQSSGYVPKGVADGEYHVGITYENVAGLYLQGGAAVKIVYPVEGTAVIPDGNALIRNAPHPEAAKRFLDFLIDKPVQEVLARELAVRSCRTDVAAPPGLPPIDEVKAAPNFDFRWSAEHRKALIEKWQAIVLRLPQ